MREGESAWIGRRWFVEGGIRKGVALWRLSGGRGQAGKTLSRVAGVYEMMYSDVL
jgi:hypothetical protein